MDTISYITITKNDECNECGDRLLFPNVLIYDSNMNIICNIMDYAEEEINLEVKCYNCSYDHLDDKSIYSIYASRLKALRDNGIEPSSDSNCETFFSIKTVLVVKTILQ